MAVQAAFSPFRTNPQVIVTINPSWLKIIAKRRFFARPRATGRAKTVFLALRRPPTWLGS
jgi:hypothetical protein